jgi:hypothetical protein
MVFSARRGGRGFICVDGLRHRQHACRPKLLCDDFTSTSSAIVEFSSVLRRPGTTPVSRTLLRALAWSTIHYRSPHTGSPSLNSRAGRHLGHWKTQWPSDERHVPVPIVPHTAKTDPAQKTGGIISHRGRPHEKVPLPASPKTPPHQQCCEVTIDGPMQFAFADPLVLPASGTTHSSSQNRSCRRLPTLRQATCQTLW